MFETFYHATTDKDFDGLSHSRGTAFISRDINAAKDALKNKYNVGEGKIIVSKVPVDLAQVLIKNERSYNGFYPYEIKGSSEIPVRTPEEHDLFNSFIV